MMSAVRIGVAGIGITSPLGEEFETTGERRIAGSGGVGPGSSRRGSARGGTRGAGRLGRARRCAPPGNIATSRAAHGPLRGAGRALEAALTTRALQKGVVPPTPGVTTTDARCARLPHVRGKSPRAHDRRHAISHAVAFGGSNVALVVSRS
jgi:hypothetical protein